MNYLTNVSDNIVGSRQLLLSQLPLTELICALRSWPYSYRSVSKVYELRVVSTNDDQMPKGCASLAQVATVEPDNLVEHYTNMLGDALERLPAAQLQDELQRQIEYLQKKQTKEATVESTI